MLQAGKQKFGRTQWRFMQDRAPGHTILKHTAAGKTTRALIEKYTSLVEDWPAHMADGNPIEKAWSATEHHLWTTEKWSSFSGFKDALKRSWAAVVTPAYCRKLCQGTRGTFNAIVKAGGEEITGWGSRAKPVRMPE